MALKSNYQDAIFSGEKKYTLTENQDNTVSLTDVTTYVQVGDTISANDMNSITSAFNNQVGSFTLWSGTVAQYNTIAVKSPTTIYFILES